MKYKALEVSSVEEAVGTFEACALKGIGTLDFSLNAKGSRINQQPTNGHQANSPKGNRMIECFGEFDPNVVHFTNAVVRWSGLSFGSPARSPSVPASCRPAAAVLRRVASRIRSVGRPLASRHTSGGLSVGCNSWAQSKKTTKTSRRRTIAAIRAAIRQKRLLIMQGR